MIYFIFILLMLLFANFHFQPKGMEESYIDKYECNVIKGVFIALVFFSHFRGYVHLNNSLDMPYILLQRYLGQFIVAMFLFYSGYGIVVSLMKKGESYLSSIPVHRMLRTLLHFDLAVLIYLAIWTGTHGKLPDASRIFSSLLAWGSLGNSNWYIFAILVLWAVTFAGFRICGIQHIERSLFATLALTIISSVVIMHFRYSEHWWYDTMICYPLGMYYAVYKPKIERTLFSHSGQDYLYWGVFALLAASAAMLGKHKGNYILYEVWMLAMTLLVVQITMKFYFKSKILSWMGGHLFEIYILMRIPMILLLPYFKGHNYRYLAVCMAATWVLTVLSSNFLQWIDKKLFASGKNP